MTENAVAIFLAAFFIVGCIAIHEFRAHAKEMTGALALVAVCLGLFVVLIAMAEPPSDASADRVHKPGVRSSDSTIANPPGGSK